MPERFLVVKLADIGDLLTATPALRALRTRLPAARIDVLAPPHSAEVLRGLSSVDDLVLFEKKVYDSVARALRPDALAEAVRLASRLRAGRYDAVLVFHHLVTGWGSLKYAALALACGAPRRYGLDNGLGRGWFLTDRAPDAGFGGAHEVDYWLRVVDLVAPPPGSPGSVEPRPGSVSPRSPTGTERSEARPKLEVATTPADEAAAEQLLGPERHPTVAIHPGSGAFSVARRWPAERFAVVADALAKSRGARIVLVGGPDEIGLCSEVAARLARPALNLAGRTTLKQLAAVLRRCDLFVGNDGGLMHLATAAGTPVVAVFGLSNHRAWGPYGYQEWPGDARSHRPGAGGMASQPSPPGGGSPTSPLSREKAERAPATSGEGAERLAHAPAPHLVVRTDLPCSPCFYRGHSLGNRFGCPTRDCLMLISPEMVVAAAESLLDAWPCQPPTVDA